MRTHALNASIGLLFAVLLMGIWGCNVNSRSGQSSAPPPVPPRSTVAPHVIRTANGVKLTDQLTLGDPIAVENVTVWPVYSSDPVPEDQGEFISLADAQEKKLAEVREISSSGQVNQLVIENKGTSPILVLAGTLVKGGKQDRQIAQDFIIGPGKTSAVDAFCVEQGRWTAQREGESTQGYFKAQKYLAVKEVRDGGQFKGSQNDVWENVSKSNSIGGKAPQTGTLFATMEEDNKEAKELRDRISKGITKGMEKTAETPFGLAYAVDGEVREIRVFNDPRILKHYSESIISTIAVEADLGQRKAKKDGKPIFNGDVDVKEVLTVVQEAEKNREEAMKTQAGNVNCLRAGEDFSSSANFASEEDRRDQKAPVSRSWSKH